MSIFLKGHRKPSGEEVEIEHGGSLSLQILGPYTVAFDTLFDGIPIQDDYIPVPDGPILPVGTVIFGIWVICVTDWDSGGQLHVGIAVNASSFHSIFISSQSPQVSPSGDSTHNDLGMGNLIIPTNSIGGIVRDAATKLFCTTDSTATEGSTDIYVLAYVPE